MSRLEVEIGIRIDYLVWSTRMMFMWTAGLLKPNWDPTTQSSS